MADVVVFDEYGPPEVLHVIEAPDPEPGPGEVRIRVRAAGVQPFDAATRRGDFAAYQPLTLPARLGNEVAGVVDAVGNGVSAVEIGRQVIAFLDLAGYADAVVVPLAQVVTKPAAMPWDVAGALSVSAQTADTALDALEVAEGDRLLVHAAAGGVGSMAVQLAVARGATVIGTARQANHDYLRGLGATPVTYGEGLAERVRELVPDGITAALDAIGGDALDVSLELLGSTKRIVTIADWYRSAELGIRRIGTDRTAERLERIVALYRSGRLDVRIARTFGLYDAAGAHALVESGHVQGKVVLLS